MGGDAMIRMSRAAMIRELRFYAILILSTAWLTLALLSAGAQA